MRTGRGPDIGPLALATGLPGCCQKGWGQQTASGGLPISAEPQDPSLPRGASILSPGQAVAVLMPGGGRWLNTWPVCDPQQGPPHPWQSAQQGKHSSEPARPSRTFFLPLFSI